MPTPRPDFGDAYAPAVRCVLWWYTLYQLGRLLWYLGHAAIGGEL